MNKLLYLLMGGAAGTLVRYLVSGVLVVMPANQLPFGTMLVNFLGCFLMGVMLTANEGQWVANPELRLLLIVGFCGGLTTFSAFIYETADLIKSGENIKAFLNVLLSVSIGFIFLKIGIHLGVRL